MIEKCEDNMPDSENFTSLYSEIAANSVEALIGALNSINDMDANSTISVGQVSVDSVVIYLEAVTDPDITVHGADVLFDKWISDAPLLKAEYEKQVSDISLLLSKDNLSEEIINTLKDASSKAGLQLIVRGLIKAPKN